MASDNVEQDFSTTPELLSPEATALSGAEGDYTEPDHKSGIVVASKSLSDGPFTPVKVYDVDDVSLARPQRMRKHPAHLSNVMYSLRCADTGTALFVVEVHLGVTSPGSSPEISQLWDGFRTVEEQLMVFSFVNLSFVLFHFNFCQPILHCCLLLLRTASV